jgi:hypothetical protein
MEPCFNLRFPLSATRRRNQIVMLLTASNDRIIAGAVSLLGGAFIDAAAIFRVVARNAAV